MQSAQLERIALFITKTLIWCVPILPIYISKSMFFLFITGRNFAFRVVVELAFALWAGLAITKKEYRPKINPIFISVSIFTAIVFLADIFGVDPYRSLFSNYERMEGFITILHLYLYFIVLVSLFKKQLDWLIFFHTSLITSLFISLIGYLQMVGYESLLNALGHSGTESFRIDSAIGNPIYLAAYLLFHVWILAMLIYRFRGDRILTIFYFTALVFELFILYNTVTRGAIVALVLATIIFVIIIVVFWKKIFPTALKLRIVGIGMLIFLIIIPIFLLSIREKIQAGGSNPSLARLTNYSLNESTVKSRLTLWNVSWQGFLERPLLGWGQENYQFVFQKYFDPVFYNHEPWFDRSHNIVFDWLINAGVLGLASYLSIFIVLLISIINATRRDNNILFECLALLALLMSYFLQNFFVFDNINTYIIFFAMIAYGSYITSTEKKVLTKGLLNDIQNKKAQIFNTFNQRHFLGVSISLLILFLIVGYSIHFKPILESKALVVAMRVSREYGSVDQIIQSFNRVLHYNTFGDTEARTQLAMAALRISYNPDISSDDKNRFFQFVIAELKNEPSKLIKDVKHLHILGMVLAKASALNPAFNIETEQVLQEAIHLSPKKQLTYLSLAEFYFSNHLVDAGIDTLQTAWSINQNFNTIGANILTYAILAKKVDVVAETRSQLRFDSLDEFSLARIGDAYDKVKNLPAALEIYDRLLQTMPSSANIHQYQERYKNIQDRIVLDLKS